MTIWVKTEKCHTPAIPVQTDALLMDGSVKQQREYERQSSGSSTIKPWQNEWTFSLNMHWTNVQCKMLHHFATLSNLVQSCSAMLRVVQLIVKAVKNVQWTRLNFFCLKEMFSRFATILNITQFEQVHCKCTIGLYFWQRHHCLFRKGGYHDQLVP